MFRHVFATLAACTTLAAAPAAHADRVFWSISVGAPGVVTTFGNARPVYPPPVAYVPPPPPRPVVYGYAPGYSVVYETVDAPAPTWVIQRRCKPWHHKHERWERWQWRDGWR